MTDHVKLLDRFASRNPVPNPADPPAGAWDLEAVRLEMMRREEAMLKQTERTVMDPLPSRSRRRWVVVAGAFVAVLVVGIGLAFVGGGSGDVPPVTTPTTTTITQPTTTVAPATATPTTVPPLPSSVAPEPDDVVTMANRFVDALFSGDVDALAALTDPTAGKVLWWSGWLSTFDAVIEDATCLQGAASNLATCEVSFTDVYSAVFGVSARTETWGLQFTAAGVRVVTWDPNHGIPALAAWGDSILERRPDLFAPGAPCEGLYQGEVAAVVDCAQEFVADAELWVAQSGA